MDKRDTLLQGIERQISRLDRRIKHLSDQSARITTWRVVTFIIGIFAIGLTWDNASLAGIITTLIAITVFAGLIRLHRRVKTSIERHQIFRLIKQQHLARMRLDWSMLPESSGSAPPDHPFAFDLDIVGQYSMHRLLDTTISRGGSNRLLDWLLITKPDLNTIQKRRNYMQSIVPLTSFRDKLTMNGTLSKGRGKWDGKRLLRWLGNASPTGGNPLIFTALVALSLANFTFILVDALDIVAGLWVITMAAYVLLYAVLLRSSGDTFSEALTIKTELDNLTSVFRFIESTSFTNMPLLQELCQPFQQSTRKPTTQLRRLNIIMEALNLRANPIFWFMVNILIPWDAYFTIQLNTSKGTLVTILPDWLNIWYELEALSALATFEYLNPAYTETRLSPDEHFVDARALGHPLIPYEVRVCNDFSLYPPDKVNIITGSNMSGKSSFLRTAGLTLQLAYAGSVGASSDFQAGLFRVFTCIKVTDSLVDGISYFYAEVQRLKALVDALDSDPMPVFFLIDEIFRGTNNRERLIGSGSYIRYLVESNAFGLISTHDLELVQLEHEIDGIQNFHFREDIHNGKMHFDYRLRAGPSPTTNALTIMKLAGLPVDLPVPNTKSP